MGTTQLQASWITEAVRRKEADLADACATAAAHVRETVVAGKLAELVFEHLRHAGPRFECTSGDVPAVDSATLRARAHRPYSVSDTSLRPAIDHALVGAIARAHAEIALFIDDACGSVMVAPDERERLLRVAFCTAAMGDTLGL